MNHYLLDNKLKGLNKTPFICAEVGITSNGDLATAKKMIDVAHNSGIHALKFQIINPDKDFSDPDMTYSYKTYDGELKTEKMIQMLKKYIFSNNDWKEIKRYGDENNVIIFATPSHLEAVDIMEDLDMPAYKICSWNVNFYPLIKKIAQTNKPIMIDSGPASDLDLLKAINTIKNFGDSEIILLYCHHTSHLNEINLNSINYLRDKFGCPVGYSSGGDPNIDIMSLAYRPAVIELRLTLDKKQEGHHHSISLEPSEISDLVRKINTYSKIIGSHSSVPTKEEIAGKVKYFRSLFFAKDMKSGELIKPTDIICKRPSNKGLDPYFFDIVIGRSLNNDVKKNDPVTWDLI